MSPPSRPHSARLPRRLRRLPLARVAALEGRELRRAHDPLARLLGLAGLRAIPPDYGLLLPGTRSIHTFGMRFSLELVWLDANERILRVDPSVRPGRVRACRGARAVVELPCAADA